MQVNEAACEKDLGVIGLRELDFLKKNKTDWCAPQPPQLCRGLRGDAHLCHEVIHTSTDLISGVSKASGSRLVWGGRIHLRLQRAGEGTLALPPRCRSVFVDFLRLFTPLLAKPLQKNHFALALLEVQKWKSELPSADAGVKMRSLQDVRVGVRGCWESL